MQNSGVAKGTLKLVFIATVFGNSAMGQLFPTLLDDRAFDNTKLIYGSDDRREPYQNQDVRLREYSKSVVALVKRGRISWDQEIATIATVPFKTAMGLDPSEPFADQPTAAFCSGSLVGPDLVLTAGHCIKSADDCNQTSFVFGFEIDESSKSARTVFSRSDVYECGEIVSQEFTREGVIDYAVVRLNRPVVNRKALEINREMGAVFEGTPLAVIGCPSGLPMKIADNAFVREESFFQLITNLDTYGGNSGSPVFNLRTGLLEGVLVRGDRDFVQNEQGLTVSNVVENDSGRGEDVVKVRFAAPFIAPLEN